VMTLLTSEIRTRRATSAGIQSLTCRTHRHNVETLSRRDNINLKSNLKKPCTDRWVRYTETDHGENQYLHPLNGYHHLMQCLFAGHQSNILVILLGKQKDVLGRTIRLLSFDTTRTAQKTKKLRGNTDTKQQGYLTSLLSKIRVVHRQ
jgi:hypothetical protein